MLEEVLQKNDVGNCFSFAFCIFFAKSLTLRCCSCLRSSSSCRFLFSISVCFFLFSWKEKTGSVLLWIIFNLCMLKLLMFQKMQGITITYITIYNYSKVSNKTCIHTPHPAHTLTSALGCVSNWCPFYPLPSHCRSVHCLLQTGSWWVLRAFQI